MLELWEISVFQILFIIRDTYKKIGVKTWPCWLSESPSTLRSACVPRTQSSRAYVVFGWPKMVGSGWLTVSCEPHPFRLCLSNQDVILKAPKWISFLIGTEVAAAPGIASSWYDHRFVPRQSSCQRCGRRKVSYTAEQAY